MKNSHPLHSVVEALAKKPVGKNFQFAIIDESKDSASYLVTPRKSSKNFVHMVSMNLNKDGFVSVELFVSNLSVTEVYADIQLDISYVGKYLGEMLAVTKTELSKSLSSDSQFTALLKQIDKGEKNCEALITKLEATEKKITVVKKDTKAVVAKLNKDLMKLEEQCIQQEIEVSQMIYRYFVNALDDVDPFFFQMLF